MILNMITGFIAISLVVAIYGFALYTLAKLTLKYEWLEDFLTEFIYIDRRDKNFHNRMVDLWTVPGVTFIFIIVFLGVCTTIGTIILC